MQKVSYRHHVDAFLFNTGVDPSSHLISFHTPKQATHLLLLTRRLLLGLLEHLLHDLLLLNQESSDDTVPYAVATS